MEAQSRRGDFGSWRVYLYDRAAGTAQRLSIVTRGGSRAFANPTATHAARPGGPPGGHGDPVRALEGAVPGEAGSLLYHVPADHQTRRAEDS